MASSVPHAVTFYIVLLVFNFNPCFLTPLLQERSGRRPVASPPSCSLCWRRAVWSQAWPCWPSSRWTQRTWRWTRFWSPWPVWWVWPCCWTVGPGGRWQTLCCTLRGGGSLTLPTACTSSRVRDSWRWANHPNIKCNVRCYSHHYYIYFHLAGIFLCLVTNSVA